MVKIMLVDDHKVVKSGVESILANNPKYHIEATASDGKEALDILQHTSIDIILMDINMKGMDGISCTKQVLHLYPDTKVLALTMQSDYQSIKSMMAAGAVGYLLKDCEEAELYQAIDNIIDTGKHYNPEVAKALFQSFEGELDKYTHRQETSLTKREKEVLKLVLEECTNKEIAKQLGISHRTVEIHKRNLLAKTDSKNVAGLVLYAVHNDML